MTGVNLTILAGKIIPIPISAKLVQSIQTVEVENNDQGFDGFEIVFSAAKADLGGIFDFDLLSNLYLLKNNRIIIMVTINGRPNVLMDGIILEHNLSPSPDSGASTFTIKGTDISRKLDEKEVDATHNSQPDNIIVTKIIASYAQYGLIPLVIPPKFLSVPTPLTDIPSQENTDLKYIQELGQKHDYIFAIETTDIPGVNTAYWGPQIRVGMPQKALTYDMGFASNITNVNITDDSSDTTFVSGLIQDSTTNVEIPIQTFAPLRIPLSLYPSWISNFLNTKTKVLRDTGGLSAVQAFAKAQSDTDETIDNVTITGELNSLKYGDTLKARKLVGLRGVGFSYDGLFYVKSVTHKISKGSYTQNFTLSRDGIGSNIPLVRV